MRRTKLDLRNSYGANFLMLTAVVVILLASFPIRTAAQQPGEKTFTSPQAATDALIMALKSSDEKALLEILGPDAKEIISSGDPAEDEATRTNFVKKYEEMHRLVKEPDGTMLYIGAENWPTPIPLVDKGGAWYFNTDAGKQEILFRRIGQNEMSAIRVCQELVAAQNEYFAKQHNEYAQKFTSDEGQHNGLYWLGADNQFESPIGPLVANAGTGGGLAKDLHSPPAPFHGYLFRLVTRQGKSAPGGAADYIVAGKMTGGFAFVAYPAEYRNSGVMTFIVGKDGVVYEKDLGKKTDVAAKSIKAYDPNSSWKKSEEPQLQSADEKSLSKP
jgi:Protein of unknown function (DUF2950)